MGKMANSATGGILDIMQGIATITSFLIAGRSIGLGFEEIFKVECPHCRGVGKVTCTKCRGSGTLSIKPAQKGPNLLTYNRRFEDVYKCPVCSLHTIPYGDLGLPIPAKAFSKRESITDTLKNAIRNRPSPS